MIKFISKLVCLSDVCSLTLKINLLPLLGIKIIEKN